MSIHYLTNSRSLEDKLLLLMQNVDSATMGLVGDKATANVLLQKKIAELVEEFVAKHGPGVLVWGAA